MATIRTAIQIQDGMTAAFRNIINSVQTTINVFQDMQAATSAQIDTSSIEAARNQINQATMAIMEMEEAARQASNEKISPQIQQPIQEIQWQSPQNIETFSNSGIERYKQEIQSATDMVNKLAASRLSLADNSFTNRLPQGAANDLASLNVRISNLRANIEKVSQNKIDDIGANQANNSVEKLRRQLNEALYSQQELTQAMTRMDINAANAAYTKLNNTIDSAEMNIRDNINVQNQFNNSLQNGQSAANGLFNKIKGLVGVYAGIQGFQKIVGLSDSMTQTTARLNMIVDDGGSVEALKSKIFQAAQESRASFMNTADLVAKISLRAGDAFSSNDQVIDFTKTSNKMFVVAGASQQEMNSASLQLVQSLGSGVLRGEELNAVFEAAPNIIQSIADYMNVPIGKVRELASEGQVSSEIVKNAVLSATDETNTAFNSMPMTWGQVWDGLVNNLLIVFQPLLNFINLFANNWSTLEPIVWGLVAAVGAYTIITGIQTAATWLSVAANRALIITLLSNPILWIALAIGILIAIIYRWVKSVGGIKVAWLICVNAIMTAWDWVKIGFFTGVYYVMGLIDKLKLGVVSTGAAIQNFIGDTKVKVLNILQSMVNGAIDIINKFIGILNNIPGVSINAVEHMTFAVSAQVQNDAAKQARSSALSDIQSEMNTKLAQRNYMLHQMKNNAISATAQRQAEIDAVRTSGVIEETTDAKDNSSFFNNMGDSLGTTAANTSKMADSMDITEEDLQYLRDLAEQETVNRFTTAEIKVDMGGVNNHISSNMDIDGIAEKLRETIEQQMNIAAEGVYA